MYIFQVLIIIIPRWSFSTLNQQLGKGEIIQLLIKECVYIQLIMYFNTECLHYCQGVCIHKIANIRRRLWDTRLTRKS